MSGGVLAVGASGNPVGTGALTIGTAANPTFGDLTFADLDLVGTSSGLAANGTGGALALSVAAGASTISASNGPAIDVSSATINLPLQSLTSTVTSGGANGVSLNTVAGTFAAPGSITSTSSTGTAFNIAGGNADVTYSGTITWDVGRLVSIAGTTGGNKTFSGAITDNGDGDGGETGVSMTGNAAAATVAFTGGVVVRTTTNAAFTATGGGTVTVIDPAGPASNTLTTTTGTALNVANTTIGTGGLVFQSISANGAANGIVLNTTGTTAGLTIAGNGGACTSAGTCTGGAIQSTTGDGIVLTNTRSTSLTRLFVGSTGNHGINATTVNGLSLTSARVENAGNGDNEHGLQLSNVTGTVAIDATTFSGAAENLVNLQNNNTNATLSVGNASAFSYPSGVGGFANSAILIQPGGTAAITASIQGATFTNIVSASAQIGANLAGSNGTQSLTFTGNTVSVTLPARAGGVVVSGQESTITNITINNNSFSGAGGNGVISIDTNDSSRVEGSASGNTITNPPGVGMFIAVDEAATNEIVVSGNTITNAGIDGIQAVNFGGVGVSTMQLAITNNQVNGHSANASLAFVGGISFTGFEDTSCLVLRGNTVTGTPAGPTQCGGAPCVDYYLEEVGGTMTLEEVPNTGSTTASAAYVNSINDAGPVTIFGVIDLTNGAACNVALMAAGGPAPACATSPVAPITETTLRKLAREAARRLDGNAATEPGSPDLVADSLAALDLTMTDLPGGQLGSAKESGVMIDRNAAGWGWFVDPTPHLDEEFEPASTETGEHRARPGGPADGRIDLLTVLMHEIEHLRGQNHATPSPSAHELMAPRLGTGVRRGRPSGRLAEPAPLVTAISLPGPPAVLAPVLSPQRRSQCTAFHARDGDTTGGDRTPDSVRKVSHGPVPGGLVEKEKGMAEPFLSEIRIMSFVFAPKGWALCNGQLLPINQNQALFSLLGTTFGGDGRVNFALPDLRAGRRFTSARATRSASAEGNRRTRCPSPNSRLTRTRSAARPPRPTRPSRPETCSGPWISRRSARPTAERRTWSRFSPQAVGNVGGSQAHLNMQPFLTLRSHCAAGHFPVAQLTRTGSSHEEPVEWHSLTSVKSGCSRATSLPPGGCSARASCCRSARTKRSSS